MRKRFRPPLYVYTGFFANLGHNSVQVKTPINIGEASNKREGRQIVVRLFLHYEIGQKLGFRWADSTPLETIPLLFLRPQEKSLTRAHTE